MATMTASSEVHEVASGELKVVVSRVIRAKRERVFEAWTNPAEVQRWFGPEGMTCTGAEVDLQAGGAYRIDMKSDVTGKESWATGVYEEIVPHDLLRFTWVGCWRAEEATLVTAAFQDVESGTEVTITHERAGADALASYEHGWTGSLAKLDKVYGE